MLKCFGIAAGLLLLSGCMAQTDWPAASNYLSNGETPIAKQVVAVNDRRAVVAVYSHKMPIIPFFIDPSDLEGQPTVYEEQRSVEVFAFDADNPLPDGEPELARSFVREACDLRYPDSLQYKTPRAEAGGFYEFFDVFCEPKGVMR